MRCFKILLFTLLLNTCKAEPESLENIIKENSHLIKHDLSDQQLDLLFRQGELIDSTYKSEIVRYKLKSDETVVTLVMDFTSGQSGFSVTHFKIFDHNDGTKILTTANYSGSDYNFSINWIESYYVKNATLKPFKTDLENALKPSFYLRNEPNKDSLEYLLNEMCTGFYFDNKEPNSIRFFNHNPTLGTVMDYTVELEYFWDGEKFNLKD